ncbi:MAG: transcriptional repressor [Oscillospiraceae bacterium]|nr:transcriptional repressor [Oscillospiraceae bacterium]
MPDRARYKTRQREQMDRFLELSQGRHFTAADVCEFFKKHSVSCSVTTVYRRLDELIAQGRVKKYYIDDDRTAWFECVGICHSEKPESCYHLKCRKCGRLIHLECDEIAEFEEHITKHHGFMVDPARTTFYGVCEKCGVTGK